MLAEWYATQSQDKQDEYYASKPNDRGYLLTAREKLVEECIQLAKRNSESERKGYVGMHKERQWMVDAAIAAKKLVESGDQEAIAKHFADHVDQQHFLERAKTIWGPKPTNGSDDASQEAKSVESDDKPAVDETPPSHASQQDSLERSTVAVESQPSDVVAATPLQSDTNPADTNPPNANLLAATGSVTTRFFDGIGQLQQRAEQLDLPVDVQVMVRPFFGRMESNRVACGLAALHRMFDALTSEFFADEDEEL